MQNSNISLLSDKELYQKCQLYGGEARKWAKRFADLLPEVARRELFRKYKFYSIYEFAAKLAGMKRETVVDILRVAQKLEDKPLLRAQMETAGWGKLKVVAGIATKENEKMLAEKVATMSLATLSTFVQEIRKQNSNDVQSRIDSGENEILRAIQPEQANLLETAQEVRCGDCEQQLLSAQTEESQQQLAPMQTFAPTQMPARIFVRLLLTPKNELKLKELQIKLSREQKAPVDLNEVFETLLDAYERQQTRPAVQKKQNVPDKVKRGLHVARQRKATSFNTIANLRFAIRQKVSSCTLIKSPSHHTPAKTKKTLHQKFASRCAWSGCTKLPEIFHHTLRFSLNPSHNPDHIVPLCKNHERLAHHGLIENEEKSPETWRLKFEADKNTLKYQIDQKVISHYAPQ